MSWEFDHAETIIARGLHACEHCSHAIEPGTRHRRMTGRLDGAAALLREHLDCRQAWEQLNFDQRGKDPAAGAPFLVEDELTPGETNWLVSSYPDVAARLGMKP